MDNAKSFFMGKGTGDSVLRIGDSVFSFGYSFPHEVDSPKKKALFRAFCGEYAGVLLFENKCRLRKGFILRNFFVPLPFAAGGVCLPVIP